MAEMQKTAFTNLAELFATTMPLPGFNADAAFAVQQRNMAAVSKIAEILARTAAEVGAKEIELYRTLAQPALPAKFAQSPAELPEFFKAQAEAGRAEIERAVERMREVGDLVRLCYRDLAAEFQACARDNWNTLESGPSARGRAAEKSASATKSQPRLAAH